VRVTLIHNPGAGKQGRENADKLVGLLHAAGHKVRYRSSKDDDWKRALKKRADLVVIAGGDGTVGRVTRRMVGRGVPLAILPSGTANNIARSLGQIERPFEDLVRGWESARRVKLDAGIAAGPWGERYFIEGLGTGLFAELLADTSRSTKKQRRRKESAGVDGALRRLRDRAKRCEPIEVAARLDGEDISGRYLLFEAVHLPYVGPNLHLAPHAKPGEGLLDVVLVTEDQRERLVHYLDTWQDNPERLAMLPSLRGKRLQIEWPGDALHIDDKLYPRARAKPKEIAGVVEARLDGAAVEFLTSP
jgi:diacylglycerol kinase (ATP)